MVVRSLHKIMSALAVCAGLAVVAGVPATAALQGGSAVTTQVFQAPYSMQP
jgi:Na+/phosphate symporter